MKVGIDTFGCDHAKSGLGSYILNFISNLPENSDFSFELFGAEVDRYTYTTNNGLPYNSVNISSKLSAEIKWHKSKIKYFLKKNKYDFVIYTLIIFIVLLVRFTFEHPFHIKHCFLFQSAYLHLTDSKLFRNLKLSFFSEVSKINYSS